MINSDIRIAIVGAAGRMGRELIQAVSQWDGLALGGALERKGSNIVGIDAGELVGIGRLKVIITDDLIDILDKFDILIDFSYPKVTQHCLSVCKEYGKGMIIGTTGFNKSEHKLIKEAAKSIPIVLSANFSIGMNLVLELLEKAVKVIGKYSNIEIIEVHHRDKIDKPSGTALAMSDVILKTLTCNLKDYKVYMDKSITSKRDKNIIPIRTIRSGDIVGKHTVIFSNITESIEINHKALSRMTFANGAIKACMWLKNRNRGLYSMRDVLNLKNI